MDQNQNQVDHAKETKSQSPEDVKHEAHDSDYAPYPKLDPNDLAPPPAAENWANVSMGPAPHSHHPGSAPTDGPAPATTMPAESNPYVSPAPAAASSSKNKMEAVKDVLGKWGKKAAEAAKKTEDLAGNMWQHCMNICTF